MIYSKGGGRDKERPVLALAAGFCLRPWGVGVFLFFFLSFFFPLRLQQTSCWASPGRKGYLVAWAPVRWACVAASPPRAVARCCAAVLARRPGPRCSQEVSKRRDRKGERLAGGNFRMHDLSAYCTPTDDDAAH